MTGIVFERIYTKKLRLGGTQFTDLTPPTLFTLELTLTSIHRPTTKISMYIVVTLKITRCRTP